jgi:hypothetical protein
LLEKVGERVVDVALHPEKRDTCDVVLDDTHGIPPAGS